MTARQDVRGPSQLRLGLLVNPWSGIGGAVALQGSDGAALRDQARAAGGKPRSEARARRLLKALADRWQTAAGRTGAGLPRLVWRTWPGAMGAQVLNEAVARLPAWTAQTLEPAATSDAAGRLAATQTMPATGPEDTRAAAGALVAAGIDLLLFVGGDGTARDLIDAGVGEQLVLGVPAGVKMHSGVFATTPEAAAEIVFRLGSGGQVAACEGAVRDLDEDARRAGQIRTQHYGTLQIPVAAGYVQQTKVAGKESEPLVLEELAAHWQAHASGQMVLGPGSTCARVKEALGLTPTLLGVDVWNNGELQGTNVTASWLAANAPAPDAVVLSFAREQGFLLGRGNQQLSASWLAGIDRARLKIVGTRSKLASLAGRPLLVDTDDPALNRRLQGLVPVLVGYEDELLYRIQS
jgi:predicted polyphosphate/ATP-dependent NAD kinase